MKYVWFIARIAVGVMMAYPGFSKLMEPVENFVAIINNYGVVPHVLILPIAYVLPWIEWICGCLLIFGYMTHRMAIALAVLCFGFVMLIASALVTGVSPDIDCGCFGESGGHFNLWQVLIFDSVYLLILLRLFFLKHFSFSLDSLLLGKSQDLSSKKMK
ncbi:MAG: MauE/DoxX family redox-associated membrane protein [Chlamydiota bacterium]|nr:MauE/DoxX family redox-associated membrane protein [Chlamydiota bacterium]